MSAVELKEAHFNGKVEVDAYRKSIFITAVIDVYFNLCVNLGQPNITYSIFGGGTIFCSWDVGLDCIKS